MADQDGIIVQFCDTTGTDPARARFYLEGSRWDLQVKCCQDHRNVLKGVMCFRRHPKGSIEQLL